VEFDSNGDLEEFVENRTTAELSRAH
jgi:hypothetical protein